jgi:hypothetical protein
MAETAFTRPKFQSIAHRSFQSSEWPFIGRFFPFFGKSGREAAF